MDNEVFLDQLLAATRMGNRFGMEIAARIFPDETYDYDTLHLVLSRLHRRTSKGTPDLNQLATELKLSPSQLEAAISITEDELLVLTIWQRACDVLYKQYYRLLSKLARKNPSGGLPTEALVRASRSYKDPNTQFITYLHVSASRAVRRDVNRDTGQSEQGRRMLAQYVQERDRLNGKTSVEDVVGSLGLDNKEKKRLRVAMQRRYITETDLDAIVSGFNSLSDMADKRRAGDLPQEVLELLDTVPLTAIERASFEAQSELRQYFTGKTFSEVQSKFVVTHQAVSLAAKRANTKVAYKFKHLY